MAFADAASHVQHAINGLIALVIALVGSLAGLAVFLVGSGLLGILHGDFTAATDGLHILGGAIGALFIWIATAVGIAACSFLPE